MPEQPSNPRQTFPRSHRLSGRRAFEAVYEAKMRKNAGPLSVLTRPNDMPHLRLGLSVSRKVGKAVTRNRIKRLIREAYRLNQHGWPGGLDVVVVVRPHEPASLADYARWLGTAIAQGAANWGRRQADK